MRDLLTRRYVIRTGVLLAIPAITACFIFRGVKTAEVPKAPAAAPVAIRTPVKAHLIDGSTVMYRQGVDITGGVLSGTGYRFGFNLTDSSVTKDIPLDSVAAMESFTGETHWPSTIIVSTVVTVGVIGILAAMGSASDSHTTPPPCTTNCGSCPTVYSDSAGHLALEAELFSLSVAPLLEHRDVHALRAQPDATGVLSLEVRDEMLETHYFNQLALLEVTHAPDESIVPDGQEHPVAVRAPLAASAMRDRTGHDVGAMFAAGRVFRSDSTLLTQASSTDLEDFIDITVPAPAGGFPADSVALVFDLKSSALSTLLLRDRECWASQGAHSVNWEGTDLATIGYVVELGRWYGRRMGMHVSVPGDSGFAEVAYVPDGGPLAWRHVAAVVPAPHGDTLRVRLAFVADHWRIRGITVDARVRRPVPRVIAPSEIVDAAEKTDSAALVNVASADMRYLKTTPGQRFTARFNVGTGSGTPRTFLLASQGYYSEWILGSWLRESPSTFAYRPGDSALVLEMHKWGAERGATEKALFTSFLPVR